jgi:parallel beta-helix repeat protein
MTLKSPMIVTSAFLAGLLSLACSSDDSSGGSAGQGGGGSGGGAGASGGGGGAPGGNGGTGGSGGTPIVEGCDVVLEPGSNDSEAVIGALIDAQSGDTICLAAGTFKFAKEISLTGADHITLKGVGATRDDVILNFKDQTEGDNAMEIDSDYFTIQDLTVIDAKGDGVKVTNSDHPTFRNVKATWSGGASSDNGTYALYPAECTNVLMEDCQVEYAADAGIYLGQSTTGIVRRNKANGNVIGIEAENSDGVELYENEAWDNACGMLIVNLPNLVRKNNERIHAHDNNIHENNHENFAHAGAFVEGVPMGSGIVLMASDDVDLHDNTISGNDGVGIIVVSWPTFSAVGGFTTDDAEYEQYAERVYIHNNTYTDNGNNPQGVYELLANGLGFDVVWDGVLDSTGAADGGASDPLLCVQEAASTTFLNLGAPPGTDAGTTSSDLTPFDCTFPAQPAVTRSP